MAVFGRFRAVLLALLAVCAQAAVYNGLDTQVLQPDGSSVPAKVFGDEFFAVTECQGFAVVRDSVSHELCYARLQDGALVSTGVRVGSQDPVALGLAPHLRPSRAVVREQSLARRRAWGVEQGFGHRLRAEARARQAGQAEGSGVERSPPAQTTTGTVIGLTVMVDFPDVPGVSSHLGEADELFNGANYKGAGNYGSVKQYFQEVSRGKFTFINLVGNRAFVRVPKPKDWYNYIDGDRAKGFRSDAEAGPMLVKDVFEVLNAADDDGRQNGYGIDYATISKANDGTVKAVNILFAGDTSGSWGEGLWPHMMPAGARALDIALPGTGSGKRIRTYQITNLGSTMAVGTIIHECGHMVCDFPDLYDYADITEGVGVYCLMSSGNHLNNKLTPGQVGGYLRYMAGWYDEADVVDLGRLGPNAWGRKTIDANKMYLYAKGGAMKSSSTEFFLLERRINTGWDTYLPDQGLAIWHIDTASSNSLDDYAYKGHNECELVQADGQDNLGIGTPQNRGDDSDLYPYGTTTSFTGSTTPAATWWDGKDSGLMVSEIGQPQEIMTFRVGQPEPYFLQHPQKVTGRTGKTVLLTARVISDPAATVRWERLAGSSWNAIAGATGEYYGFTVKDADIGAYFRCVATNTYGTTSSSVAELVYEPLPSENTALPATPGASGHPVPAPVYALPAAGGGSSGCGVGTGLGLVFLASMFALRLWRRQYIPL